MSIPDTNNKRTKPLATPKGQVVRSDLERRIVTFLMVVGPGFIVMVADNDAGAVSAYTQAGARYGTHLLWLLRGYLVLMSLMVAFHVLTLAGLLGSHPK